MKTKSLPKFKDEDAERAFWSKNDSSSYVNWENAVRVKFPKLRPSLRTISLRLPQGMIEDLKILSNREDVPYQSLLKLFLSERIQKEFAKQSKVAKSREKSMAK